MTQSLTTMTIQEAAALWPDPRRPRLNKWGAEFNQPLEDLHSGHVITYQTQRHAEVDASVVNIEVDALRGLLKYTGIGEEIERYYHPLNENIELMPGELMPCQDAPACTSMNSSSD